MTEKEFFGSHRRITVLASSRHAADDLVRSSCEAALLGVNRYTLRDLVFALSSDRMNQRGLSPVSHVARHALAASVAQRANLNVLREVAGFPGFPRALSRSLRDLRLNRVELDRLARTGRTGADLALLLDMYESELDARGFADYPARVELAIEEALSRPADALMLIDVVANTAAENELIDILEQRAPAVLRLPVDDARPPDTCLTSVKQFALSRIAPPQRAPDATFAFRSASSESLECVEIARQILYGGILFDDIAILLRNPERQAPLIREALERAGVPAWYSQGAQQPDVAGRAFLLILQCREERYSAARFAEYLSLGQFPRDQDRPVAYWRWEALLRDAAVIAGANRWPARLAAAADRLYARYLSSHDKHVARDLDALEALRAFAVPIIECLEALPDGASWRDWISILHQLAALTLTNPRSVHDLLDEFAPLADLGPVTAGEVLQVLESHLLTFQAPESSTRYGKVFVAPITEARGMRFRYVFLPGLNEGMFPRAVREDPLLLDDQRTALEMPGSENDAELLRIAIACATEHLSVSCARVDLATGRARVPSFFAAEMLRAAYGSGTDISKLLEQAKCASETTIGWSAPSDPMDSIDTAEYDLASFRAAAKARTAGGYAWIAQVNSHAYRAINSRIDRWKTEWTSADGLSNTDVHVSSILQAARLKTRAYSVSGLQKFARCPYLFFLSEIVGLSPVEEPEILERMDALVRGRLYHKVLFHLFRDGTDGIRERLDDILQRLATEVAEEHAPPLAGIWRTDVEKLRSDLRAWLAIREPDWNPLHVELSFGIPDRTDHDPASIEDCITLDGGYKLTGSVDLVEQHTDGRLRVVDHKTGRFPLNRKNCIMGGGEVLQPVLYALAVGELAGQTPVQAQLSYATLRGGYRTIPVRIDADTKHKVLQVLGFIDNWIDKAFLPAAPKRDGCKGCDYLPVCGPYEEERVAAKTQADLRDLSAIRRLQ